jgi:uncharacterized protein (DUF1499 family)
MNNNNTGSQRLTMILTILAAIAGLGLAAAALLAPLGVWLQLWDFRQGFSILRGAQPLVTWITVGCALIAAIVFVLGKRSADDRTTRNTAIAAAATIAAAIAWYIPQSYLPGEGSNIPPIHDITTDLANPPAFVAVMPLRGENSNTTVYGTSPNMTPERQADLQRQAYPDITTQYFDEPADQVFARALQAVDRLGWDLVAQSPEEGRIEATDTTFWFRFKDDVVIRIRETSEGSALDARSTSRVGVSDVGKNAQRLRAFFAEL